MREIKFRGKSLKTGEWAYGFYVKGFEYVDDHVIIPLGGYPIPVDPETVGQFLSIKDDEGKELFEGDVVALSSIIGEGVFELEITADGYFGIQSHLKHIKGYECATHIMDSVKLCGNKYDNPELLESGNE